MLCRRIHILSGKYKEHCIEDAATDRNDGGDEVTSTLEHDANQSNQHAGQSQERQSINQQHNKYPPKIIILYIQASPDKGINICTIDI